MSQGHNVAAEEPLGSVTITARARRLGDGQVGASLQIGGELPDVVDANVLAAISGALMLGARQYLRAAIAKCEEAGLDGAKFRRAVMADIRAQERRWSRERTVNETPN